MSATSTFSSTLSKSDLRITDAAQGKLAELLKDADDEVDSVRVFVSGGGCGGMQYGMTFAHSNAATAHDARYEDGGVKVYVDAFALEFLRGAEIDFVDRPTGASFVFRDVFQAVGGSGTCGGCGSAAGGGCA